MNIVMNMSNYEIEYNSMEAEYGEEVMSAGWNPAVALMCPQQRAVPASGEMSIPPDLATVEANLFLQKMYVCQR